VGLIVWLAFGDVTIEAGEAVLIVFLLIAVNDDQRARQVASLRRSVPGRGWSARSVGRMPRETDLGLTESASRLTLPTSLRGPDRGGLVPPPVGSAVSRVVLMTATA
jgi:hypothetical protein